MSSTAQRIFYVALCLISGVCLGSLHASQYKTGDTMLAGAKPVLEFEGEPGVLALN